MATRLRTAATVRGQWAWNPRARAGFALALGAGWLRVMSLGLIGLGVIGLGAALSTSAWAGEELKPGTPAATPTQEPREPKPSKEAVSPERAEALKLFEEMFGQRVREARLAKGNEAKKEVVSSILDAAREGPATGGGMLRVVLTEKAYELGARDWSTYRQAAEAAKLLARIAPDRNIDGMEKLLALYMDVYDRSPTRFKREGTWAAELMIDIGYAKQGRSDFTGASAIFRRAMMVAQRCEAIPVRDRARTGLDGVQGAIVIDKKLKIGRMKLEKDPKDKDAAASLVLAYLVDMDDPHNAAPFAELGLPEDKQDLLLLAIYRPGHAASKPYLALAQWYLDLFKQASPPSKPAMLHRARMYAEHFRDRSRGASDEDQAKVEKLLSDIAQYATVLGVSDAEYHDRVRKLRGRFLNEDLAVNVEHQPDEPGESPAPTQKPMKGQPTQPGTQPGTKPDSTTSTTPARQPEQQGAPTSSLPTGKFKKLPPPVSKPPVELDEKAWMDKPSIFDFGG